MTSHPAFKRIIEAVRTFIHRAPRWGHRIQDRLIGAWAMTQHINRLYSSFIHDYLMAALAFFATTSLVLDRDAFSGTEYLHLWIVFLLVVFGAFLITGMYRWMWRYVSRRDTFEIIGTITLVTFLTGILLTIMEQPEPIPPIFHLVLWFTLVSCLVMPRFLWNHMRTLIHDWRMPKSDKSKKAVVLLGIEEETSSFIRTMALGPQAEYQILGIVAKEQDHVGRMIHGIPILATPETFEGAIRTLFDRNAGLTEVLLLDPTFSGPQLSHIAFVLEQYGLAMKKFRLSWEISLLTRKKPGGDPTPPAA